MLARIPVVVMTGAADRDQEALAVNAAGYFLKPYNVTTLLDLVAIYRHQPRSERSREPVLPPIGMDCAASAPENQQLSAVTG